VLAGDLRPSWAIWFESAPPQLFTPDAWDALAVSDLQPQKTALVQTFRSLQLSFVQTALVRVNSIVHKADLLTAPYADDDH
jgi:hypothetical protein